MAKKTEYKAVESTEGKVELIESTQYLYKRDRKFSLVTYIDEEYLLKYLKTAKYIQHWCYILHDMDYNEAGKPAEPHYHVLLYTRDAKTTDAILKNFERYSTDVYRYSEQLTQHTRDVQICHDLVAMYRYLLHLDNPEKYRYSSDRRIHDNIMYWTELEGSDGATANNSGLMIITDMLNGMSEMELVVKYGNAYIYHRQQYLACVHSMYRQDQLRKSKSGNIYDILRVILEDSPFSKSQVNDFYNILTHLQVECKTIYQSSLDMYLNLERK